MNIRKRRKMNRRNFNCHYAQIGAGVVANRLAMINWTVSETYHLDNAQRKLLTIGSAMHKAGSSTAVVGKYWQQGNWLSFRVSQETFWSLWNPGDNFSVEWAGPLQCQLILVFFIQQYESIPVFLKRQLNKTCIYAISLAQHSIRWRILIFWIGTCFLRNPTCRKKPKKIYWTPQPAKEFRVRPKTNCEAGQSPKRLGEKEGWLKEETGKRTQKETTGNRPKAT